MVSCSMKICDLTRKVRRVCCERNGKCVCKRSRKRESKMQKVRVYFGKKICVCARSRRAIAELEVLQLIIPLGALDFTQ